MRPTPTSTNGELAGAGRRRAPLRKPLLPRVPFGAGSRDGGGAGPCRAALPQHRDRPRGSGTGPHRARASPAPSQLQQQPGPPAAPRKSLSTAAGSDPLSPRRAGQRSAGPSGGRSRHDSGTGGGGPLPHGAELFSQNLGPEEAL